MGFVSGGKGQRHDDQVRQLIIKAVDVAVASGASRKLACELLGLDVGTLRRWGKYSSDGRAGPNTTPRNKLSEEEVEAIRKVLYSPEFRDKSPHQIVATLADRNEYVGSESSMYRILREDKSLKDRSNTKPARKLKRPREYVATAPNQVWTWDITYMKSPTRGLFYYAYVIIDLFSRKVVGFAVHQDESGDHASTLIELACVREGVRKDELVIHSDNGSPMKSSTLKATLENLGVHASFSRPSVSNDNPFSEAIFRTAKYRPDYPKGPFASLEVAKEWFSGLVGWYNCTHRHSGITFVTPMERHNGEDEAILDARRAVYARAQERNPERWSGTTRLWTYIKEVRLNPELATLVAAE